MGTMNHGVLSSLLMLGIGGCPDLHALGGNLARVTGIYLKSGL